MGNRQVRFGAVAVAALCSAVSLPALAAPRRHASNRADAQEAELRALRAQVAALTARLDAQEAAQRRAETIAVAAQAQAEAARNASQASAAQAAASQDAGNGAAKAVAAKQVELAARLDKDEHPDHIAYRGVSITPGGFVEFDGIYRSHDQASDIATPFNTIPFSNNRVGRTSELRFSARHSRVSLLAEGKVSDTVRLAAYGELDFLGAAQTANSNESNSYTPRIRNMYGTIDWTLAGGNGLHLLAGQNWSLVTMNGKGITPRNEVVPAAIDAQYLPGFAWTRQPQIRLTADLLDRHLWIAVSAENPQTTSFTVGTPAGAVAGSAGAAAPLPASLTFSAAPGANFNAANPLSLNHLPDFVAKIAFETKIGTRTMHVEAFGLYREFTDRIDDKNDNVSGVSGGGSIALQLVPDAVDVQFSGMIGRGVGRYGTSQLPDVTFRPDGTIAPLGEYMLLGGIITHPTKRLDVYAFAGEDVIERRSYTTPAGLAYGYGNPLYTNAGCTIEGSAVCNGNTRSLRQVEMGFWQRLYQGAWGRVQIGGEYSHTVRRAFDGVGGAPEGQQDIGLVSFRYYPF